MNSHIDLGERFEPLDHGYKELEIPPRNGTFAGLTLDDELTARDAEPWCGVLVVNVATGDIVEWVRLEGDIIELFDVCTMPEVACPMAIGPNTPEIAATISFVG